jgi:hypothetical protein
VKIINLKKGEEVSFLRGIRICGFFNAFYLSENKKTRETPGFFIRNYLAAL